MMFCRGYLGTHILLNTRCNSFAQHLKRGWFLIEQIGKFRCVRDFSSSAKQITKTIVDVKPREGYVTFDEILERRRLQAKKSILVQVHSEQSCLQLREYCLRFGSVSKMLHYSLQPSMHFVIVEFEEPGSAECVLSKSTHTENSQIIPARSQFLWFKANDNGKVKTKVTKAETNDNLIQFGSLKPPSFQEISSWLLAPENICEQMLLLYQATRLDDLGTRLRFITALQVESTLSGIFPLICAIPYGSSVNSFGKLNCDLDVVVNLDLQTPSTTMLDNRLIFQTKTSLVNSRSQQQRYIETIGDLIERYQPGCCSVKRILLARVPILKFRQEYTGVECDLSLMNMSGVYMSELLHIYSSIDERVCPLVYTIRYWAQTINLTNPTPGRWITNFSLTLLVLFYLQQVKIIPTLDQLIKLARPEDRRFADDINCTFLRDISPLLTNPSVNPSSLTDLLKGFFDYFSLFDFDSHAISLKSGKVLPKQEYSALYIVNPLESHLNVSKNVSPEELGRIRIEICNAARCLERDMSINDRDKEEWGLVTLFRSSHYNSQAKNVIYNTVQRKQQQTLASTNRLITVTDLFAEDETESDNEINKQTYHQHHLSRPTKRKR